MFLVKISRRLPLPRWFDQARNKSSFKMHCLTENEDPVALVMGPAYAHVDMNDMEDMTKAYKMTRKADQDEFQSAEAGFQ